MDPFRTAAAPTWPCPRCAIGLGTRHVLDAVLNECMQCYGVFVPGELVPRLLDPLDLGLEVVETFPPGEPHRDDQIRYVACPRCRELMNRRLLVRGSNVIVDQCPRHGVWFDTHELRRLAELAATTDVKLRADPPPSWQRPHLERARDAVVARARELTVPIERQPASALETALEWLRKLFG